MSTLMSELLPGAVLYCPSALERCPPYSCVCLERVDWSSHCLYFILLGGAAGGGYSQVIPMEEVSKTSTKHLKTMRLCFFLDGSRSIGLLGTKALVSRRGESSALPEYMLIINVLCDLLMLRPILKVKPSICWNFWKLANICVYFFQIHLH